MAKSELDEAREELIQAIFILGRAAAIDIENVANATGIDDQVNEEVDKAKEIATRHFQRYEQAIASAIISNSS
jgi:hypothetical protein